MKGSKDTAPGGGADTGPGRDLSQGRKVWLQGLCCGLSQHNTPPQRWGGRHEHSLWVIYKAATPCEGKQDLPIFTNRLGRVLHVIHLETFRGFLLGKKSQKCALNFLLPPGFCVQHRCFGLIISDRRVPLLKWNNVVSSPQARKK